MTIGFIHWYFALSPLWIARLIWNMQRAILQYFSVDLMLKTLFAHWRKDATAYHGSLTNRLMTFALNQISRCIGFFVRIIVLAVWVVVEIIFVVSAVFFFGLFIAWPGLIALGFFTSFWLLQQYV